MASRSYRLLSDSGHAPCAFESISDLIKVTDENCLELGSGLLTLSTCARNVRLGVNEGDYVFGIAGSGFKEKAGKLIWAGRVSSVMSKADYFNAFGNRPDSYYMMKDGKYVQIANPFHDMSEMKSDLHPANVLLFKDEWWYFGSKASEPVPRELMAERQEAKILDAHKVHEFIFYIKSKHQKNRVLGQPNDIDRQYLLDSGRLSMRDYLKLWKCIKK